MRGCTLKLCLPIVGIFHCRTVCRRLLGFFLIRFFLPLISVLFYLKKIKPCWSLAASTISPQTRPVVVGSNRSYVVDPKGVLVTTFVDLIALCVCQKSVQPVRSAIPVTQISLLMHGSSCHWNNEILRLSPKKKILHVCSRAWLILSIPLGCQSFSVLIDNPQIISPCSGATLTPQSEEDFQTRRVSQYIKLSGY